MNKAGLVLTHNFLSQGYMSIVKHNGLIRIRESSLNLFLFSRRASSTVGRTETVETHTKQPTVTTSGSENDAETNKWLSSSPKRNSSNVRLISIHDSSYPIIGWKTSKDRAIFFGSFVFIVVVYLGVVKFEENQMERRQGSIERDIIRERWRATELEKNKSKEDRDVTEDKPSTTETINDDGFADSYLVKIEEGKRNRLPFWIPSITWNNRY